MSPFVIGKWDARTNEVNLDQKKIQALNNRRSTEMKHCKGCPVQLYCGGYCLGEIVNETGSLYGQNKIKCEAIIKLFEKMGPCDTYDYLHP